jgi:plasmid stabilization system protein ParE
VKRRVRLRPGAERDLREARNWYGEQAPGLGEEFLRAVDAALSALPRHPERHPTVHGDIRRALLRKFPYAVFYLVEENRIVVLACLHVRRDPEEWPDREK